MKILIEALYNVTINKVESLLSQLTIFQVLPHRLKQLVVILRGFFFETVIEFNLKEELEKRGLKIDIVTQFPVRFDKNDKCRAKTDLCINGKVAIELKLSGLWNLNNSFKYANYKHNLERRDIVYLYLTHEETKNELELIAKKTFGEENHFNLQHPNEWNRFLDRIEYILITSINQSQSI